MILKTTGLVRRRALVGVELVVAVVAEERVWKLPDLALELRAEDLIHWIAQAEPAPGRPQVSRAPSVPAAPAVGPSFAVGGIFVGCLHVRRRMRVVHVASGDLWAGAEVSVSQSFARWRPVQGARCESCFSTTASWRELSLKLGCPLT